jgi:hypothetical protein
MSIPFSDTVNNLGILQRARKMARVDSTQWETFNVVNSCNDWLNKIFTYGKGNDIKFQLDDTNHTKLPIGTTALVAGQSDYSFLTDEQGNRITNLTRIDILDSDGLYRQLRPIDQAELTGWALDEWNKTAGKPLYYDKIADNVIRLYPKPDTAVTNGLKFYFQRSPSYFTASDTTKAPGVADDLHRGFVVASAYDAAMTLGLDNLQALSVELQKEEQKLEDYFATRQTDEPNQIIPKYRSSR